MAGAEDQITNATIAKDQLTDDKLRLTLLSNQPMAEVLVLNIN